MAKFIFQAKKLVDDMMRELKRKWPKFREEGEEKEWFRNRGESTEEDLQCSSREKPISKRKSRIWNFLQSSAKRESREIRVLAWVLILGQACLFLTDATYLSTYLWLIYVTLIQISKLILALLWRYCAVCTVPPSFTCMFLPTLNADGMAAAPTKVQHQCAASKNPNDA